MSSHHLTHHIDAEPLVDIAPTVTASALRSDSSVRTPRGTEASSSFGELNANAASDLRISTLSGVLRAITGSMVRPFSEIDDLFSPAFIHHFVCPSTDIDRAVGSLKHDIRVHAESLEF